ncbi:MAG: single-stranded-DNA-specific exonuclease RecJ [Polyangiales bacterium]
MNDATLSEPQQRQAAELARDLRLHPLVARALVRRGGVNPAQLKRYLHPRLADLTRPDAMVDREVAAERLARAIHRRERVAVFGDYDVDGITSAALLTRALRAMGAEVAPFVASRFDGGYGFSGPALERVMASSPRVIVTCDCGTSDHPRIESARARGVDVIVVDHHKVPDEPLPALAFLNPHRPECGFPFKHLASVGLAFSIAAAVRARVDATLDLRPYLDLVALGTIADVAPLEGDNRVLVRAGLARINAGESSPGVRALLQRARLRQRLSARDVAFNVAPALNAPGRLGAATPTLDLLLSESEAEAAPRAQALIDANSRRKEISADLIEQATRQVTEVYGHELPAGIVLAGEGWHHGMGGIVAGRLVDRLGVAVAVVALDGEVGVGSVRGPRGTRLYDAVAACREELTVFGGHDAAAGLTVPRARIDALRARFGEAVERAGRVEVRDPPIDARVFEADLSHGLAPSLEQIEPTGEGNAELVAELVDATLAELRVVAETHLRATFSLGRRSLSAFLRDGVATRARGELPAVGQRVEVVGRLRPDPWSGDEGVQIDVTRLRPA